MDKTPASPVDGAAIVALTGRDRAPGALICFSHLRWDFVIQRPQHLMTRFAATREVIYFEEPIETGVDEAPTLRLREDPSGVVVATPHLPRDLAQDRRDAAVAELLDGLVADRDLVLPVLWYYTPMMLPFSRHLEAICTVYDCMDELANFKFAPPELTILERELMGLADVV
ncbi:MAG: UDP-galactopyranose mutase, partial [Brevundimonas sp.]|nr:UDP-galactopyranose mutase [Brevundimonas sp.]